MPKKGKKQVQSESQSEQLQDVMAWGNRRQNYYQSSQNQESSLQQEELQANKIYQRQLEQLADEDYYELPAEQQHIETDQPEEKAVSHQYLTKQIKSMTKLGLRVSELKEGNLKTTLEKHILSYLMILISIRDLQIAFLEYHPILKQAAQLKEDIGKLKSLMQNQVKTQVEEENQQDLFENQQQQNEEWSQRGEQQEHKDQEADQGMQLYQQQKRKQIQVKKIKQNQRDRQFKQNKKPAFAQVGQQQGRLASQKILKNKGLMKKRKKIDRNSRVKHRIRFSKATSKRRAYGHFMRENPGREYQGERNIKYGRIAGTKLK